MAIRHACKVCHLRVVWEGTGVNEVLMFGESSLPPAFLLQLHSAHKHAAQPQASVKSSDITSCHHTEKLEQRTDLHHTHMVLNHQDWMKLGFVLDCKSWIPLALWIWVAERK